MAVNMMDSGGGRPRPKPKPTPKPHNYYGVGQGTPHTGAGSINYKPKPRPVRQPKRPLSKKVGQLTKSPKIYDVYGSGGYGSGSGGSGGYGGYGSRGYGSGYSSGPSAADLYAQQKKDEEAKRQKEINRARAEAKSSLNAQLALIDRAIKNVNTQYSADRADWLGREQSSLGDISSAYAQMARDTPAMNAAALGQLSAAQGAAQSQGQSLIDSIVGRNNETQSELSTVLDSMGLGKATAQDQVESDSSLALAEMLARGQQAQTTADYGLSRSAQQAVGNWEVSGQQTDKRRSIDDIKYEIGQMLLQLQRDRDKSLREQDSQRIAARGEYDSTIKGLAEL